MRYGDGPFSLSSLRRRQARNAANLRIGSRMQQACEPGAEEAIEAVRNREDGTRESGWPLIFLEWTLQATSMDRRNGIS
jgi:hypothetical protein